MGVCSTSGPVRAVLPAPTALEGARGDVCALLPRLVEHFTVVVRSAFPQPLEPKMSKSPPRLWAQRRWFMLVLIPQKRVSFLGS